MEEKIIKSQNRTKVLVAVMGLFGIIVGTFGGTIGMKIYNEKFGENIVPQNNVAHVEEHNGILIFFKSRPHSNLYTKIGNVNTNAVFRAIENAEGKKGLKNILKGIGESFVKDLSFENRLNIIVDKTKEQFPNVEGIIFSKDLTQCEAIKF